MRAFMVFLLVLAVVGCNSSDGTKDTVASTTTAVSESTVVTTVAPTTTVATTTTADVTTTTGATTTTAAPTTTTTTAGDPYEVGDPDLYPLAPLPGSDGAGGSGCAPGAGPLPDGVWFGYVHSIGAASVDFDLACFYFGDIAYTKGAEDGVEVANDWYVRNTNPTLRTVPVAAGATVYELDVGNIGFLTVPFPDWPDDPAGLSDWDFFWLFVNGGEITEILEQFVP
ncbi:MAG: hypothetical protein U9N79_06270 [Actinomycetota bacterium]|nr:hypothetical protein [Actinomycetota bacterium]